MKHSRIFMILFFTILFICLSTLGYGKNVASLVVGIENYKNFPVLLGPSNDIRNIVYVLKKIYKNDNLHIKILKDEKATKENIIKSLEEMKNESDIVVFYFSGHGSRIPDRNGDEKDGLDEVLCPYDFSNSSVSLATKTSVIDDTLNKVIKSWKAKEKIVIIDACHSGTVYKDTDNSIARFIPQKFYVRSVESGEALFTHTEEEGIKDLIFISGAKDNEKARSVKINDMYYGALTYLIKKGLTSKGDINKDGKITWGELKEFVLRYMPLYPVNSSQHPEFFFGKGISDKDVIIRLKQHVPSPKEEVVKILPNNILKPGETYKISFSLDVKTTITIKEKNPKGEIEEIYPVEGISYTYKPIGPGKIILPLKGVIVNIEFFAGDIPGKYQIIIVTKDGKKLTGSYEVR